MKLRLAAALLLSTLGAFARAQTAAPADAELPAIARRLQDTAGLSARDARAVLQARSDFGDAPSRELLAALNVRASAVALGARLAALDAGGALRARVDELSLAFDAARHAAAALALITNDKGLPSVPLPPPGQDEHGWESRVEAFTGAAKTRAETTPAVGVAGSAEYEKAPWKLALEGRGLFGLDGWSVPIEGDFGAEVTRHIGGPRLRAFGGAELHRDDEMGLQSHLSGHAGVEGDPIASERQTLTAGFGAGAATERHSNGESERHPLLLARLTYALQLSARAAFEQEFELEQNPRSGRDYEFGSVTALVYDLPRTWSLRLANEYLRRGDPVPGYAGRRRDTTLGFVWRPAR